MPQGPCSYANDALATFGRPVPGGYTAWTWIDRAVAWFNVINLCGIIRTWPVPGAASTPRAHSVRAKPTRLSRAVRRSAGAMDRRCDSCDHSRHLPRVQIKRGAGYDARVPLLAHCMALRPQHPRPRLHRMLRAMIPDRARRHDAPRTRPRSAIFRASAEPRYGQTVIGARPIAQSELPDPLHLHPTRTCHRPLATGPLARAPDCARSHPTVENVT